MNPEELQKLSSAADIQQAVPQAAMPMTEENSIKQQAAKDINIIQNLVQSGVMSSEQGYNLMNYVTQKAFEKYSTQQQDAQIPPDVSSYKLEDDEFFNIEGRTDVLDYIKNSNTAFDKDEIAKISAMIENIEKTAIARYMRELDHEKTLNNENESAKQRLRANAQKAVSDGNKNMVFTRDQIGKMSGAEFAKNERMIMDQLRKGLIR